MNAGTYNSIPNWNTVNRYLSLVLNFAINSLNGHSRTNGNPVPDQVEDKHSQLVVDSRVRDCVVIPFFVISSKARNLNA